MAQWQTWADCSAWLLDAFGEQLARDGWCDGDLFGVRPDCPGWGGLVDRLGDCRALVLSADSARWRAWDVVEKFNRTAGDGLPLWWEAEQ